MNDWQPATEAEVALRDALRANDQELYFQILSQIDLLLPASADLPGAAPSGWGTWTDGGRTHVLAFTSVEAVRACLRESAGATWRTSYRELAAHWPNPQWWLAVNPGLPIEGYLPAWFVAQLVRGDVRIPGRTMGARARLDRWPQNGATRTAVPAPVPAPVPAYPPAPAEHSGRPPVVPVRPAPTPPPTPVPPVVPSPTTHAEQRRSGVAASSFVEAGEPALTKRPAPSFAAPPVDDVPGPRAPEHGPTGDRGYRSLGEFRPPPPPSRRPPTEPVRPTVPERPDPPVTVDRERPDPPVTVDRERPVPAKPLEPTELEPAPPVTAPPPAPDHRPLIIEGAVIDEHPVAPEADRWSEPEAAPVRPVAQPWSGAGPVTDERRVSRGPADSGPTTGGPADSGPTTGGPADAGPVNGWSPDPEPAHGERPASPAAPSVEPSSVESVDRAAEPPLLGSRSSIGPSGTGQAARGRQAAGQGAQAFVPANEVEASLYTAAVDGSTDTFLSTLLLARVLLPVAPDSAPEARPGDDGFVWRTETIDGVSYVVVFTSTERRAEHLTEPVPTIEVRFVQLIRRWPATDWSFAVNPGSPVGAKLPGEQIVALANWAAEVGLGDDDPTPPADLDDEPTGGVHQQAAPAESTPAEAAVTAVPDDPTRPVLMQKVISPGQLRFYLERGYDRVAGFVQRVNEVAHLRTPAELYTALGLGHPRSPFSPDAELIYALRWPAHRPNLYRIPYGGQSESAMRAMDGWMIERPPYRGNGFTPGDSSDVIAEFKVDSVRLPHGAQLWRLGRDGSERLVATLDADLPGWAPVVPS